jgi:quercetin dioxygenase-like cupin family protein
MNWGNMRLRIAALSSLMLLVPAAEHAQQAAAPSDLLAPVSRFQGDAHFKGKDGRTRDAQVTIRQWTIFPKQKVDPLPEKGFLLVTVRAGKVTTTINGQQQERKTDDFWTVPENAKMSVEGSGEAALLEVLSLTAR